MKLLVFSLVIQCILNYSYQAPSCYKSNFCMACNSSTENKCDACFNWASGGAIKARGQDATNYDCQEELEYQKVANCKFYDGQTQELAAARTITSCYVCNKDYLRWQVTSLSAECTDLQPLNCSFINHCLTVVCYDGDTAYNGTSGSTGWSYGCRMCKSGYKGSGWDATNGAGSTSCVSGTAITNCDYAVATSASAYNCYGCKSNYAVASTQTTCTSYTTTSNCRLLNSAGDCHYCWHSYYWDTADCILSSYLYKNTVLIGIVLGAIIALI